MMPKLRLFLTKGNKDTNLIEYLDKEAERQGVKNFSAFVLHTKFLKSMNLSSILIVSRMMQYAILMEGSSWYNKSLYQKEYERNKDAL